MLRWFWLLAACADNPGTNLCGAWNGEERGLTAKKLERAADPDRVCERELAALELTSRCLASYDPITPAARIGAIEPFPLASTAGDACAELVFERVDVDAKGTRRNWKGRLRLPESDAQTIRIDLTLLYEYPSPSGADSTCLVAIEYEGPL